MNQEVNIIFNYGIQPVNYNIKKLEEYYYKKIGKYYYSRVGNKILKGNVIADTYACDVYFLVGTINNPDYEEENENACTCRQCDNIAYENALLRYNKMTYFYKNTLRYNELNDFYKQLNMTKYSFLNLHKYFNAKTNPEYYIYMCLRLFCQIEDVTDIIWSFIYFRPLYCVEFDRQVLKNDNIK